MIKGRESGKAVGGAPSADLLVCFPSRAHLTLLPKPICSPARPSEPTKRLHHHHLKRVNTHAAGGGPNSPLIWAKTNQIAEPTSPKVTCAGQIKVRPRSSSSPSPACRNWQSVMEEIERIHKRGKQKKRSSKWVEAFGFKKEVLNFLTCLRNIRFDFGCFGSYPDPGVSSDDDEDEEFEEADNNGNITNNNGNNNNTVFSRWFMVLQENKERVNNKKEGNEIGNDEIVPAVPPPNALLLMRCRSAPAKSWLEERERKEASEENQVSVIEEEENNNKKKKKRESLAIVMKYDTDFYELSSDVAQETWVVGGIKDPFSRSRSWRG